jgi:hypothetical protein
LKIHKKRVGLEPVQPMHKWHGDHTQKDCRDRTQLGILYILQDKNYTKMDATANLHMHLDFNINSLKEF